MKRSALVVLAVLLFASAALGYTTLKTSTNKQKKWAYTPVQFHLSGTCDPKQTDRAACLAALRNGFARWSRLTCSSLKFVEGTAAVRISSSDSENSVAWVTSWPATNGDDALAVTYPVANEYTGSMYDADISFNPNKIFSTSNATGTTDVESVITHEAGHLLGLDHSLTADATMFYATGPNEIFRRSLTADDIQGGCSIYANGKPLPAECAVSADCSSFETCNGGLCSGGSGPGSRVYGQVCDPNNNCAKQFTCIGVDATTSKCSQLCDPNKPSNCPNADQCVALSSGTGGACYPGSAPPPAAAGEPCTTNVNCLGRNCALNPADGKTYCSQSCDPKAPSTCPAGYFCGFTATRSGSCFAGTAPQSLKRVGVLCAKDDECVTDFCAQSLRDPTRAYCAQICDSQNRCPPSIACALITPSRGVCRPGEIGDTCTSAEDCALKFCVTDPVDPSQRYCSEPCTTCPADYECGAVSQGQKACVKKQPKRVGTKIFGEACGGDADCASSLCGAEKVCTHLCGDCEAGFECSASGSDKVCTRKKDATPAEPATGCGCGTAGTAELSVFGIALAAMLGARRRRLASRVEAPTRPQNGNSSRRFSK